MKPTGNVTFRKKLIERAVSHGAKKLRVFFRRAQFGKLIEAQKPAPMPDRMMENG
jgi:hypothetical protein